MLLSSVGLVARSVNDEPLMSSGPRAQHDVVVSAVRTTARGEYGALTSTGRLIRCQAIDLPTLPSLATAPNLQGGLPLSELIQLDPGEKVLALTSLGETTFGWAFGTAKGVVKRANPEQLAAKDAWDVIRLDDGDSVIGAVELPHDELELVFVTTDAQLLHFPASAVRPQGRSGGGMAGINLAPGARAVFFGASRTADSSVVTVAGSSTALPGTDVGSLKVTPFELYPAKGRATGGVRCHRFLKGEDVLLSAWVGADPTVAAAASGSPIELPEPDPRRDGSGTPGTQPIDRIGSRYLA